MQFVEGLGGQYGHEGEAIGWEGWAGHDPETGQTTVVFTNTCSDSTALFEARSPWHELVTHIGSSGLVWAWTDHTWPQARRRPTMSQMRPNQREHVPEAINGHQRPATD